MYDQVCAERDSLQSLVSELRTQIGALNDECKESNSELEELKARYNELRKNRQLDLSAYEAWPQYDVLHWILSLEGNRFGKYEETLRQKFIEQGIDGECLKDTLKSDIAEWGIKHFKDKTSLYKHIQQLVSGHVQSANEGNLTSYI